MKAMLDKEFDHAFKSSFEDFEVEPIVKSWENISAQLDKKAKSKKPTIFWLSVAASLIIVLSIGINFLKQPDTVIKLKGNQTKEPVNNQIAKTQTPKVSTNHSNGVVNEPLKASTPNGSLRHQKVDNLMALVNEKKVLEKKINADATFLPKENVLVTDHVSEELVVKPIKKIKSVAQQMIDDEAIQKQKINSETVLAQNSTDENLSQNGANNGKKLKIKSVGDLVNFVVAKVDKREEKIITVSKTDESDNEITGINLGLFKFRKVEK